MVTQKICLESEPYNKKDNNKATDWSMVARSERTMPTKKC